jgi:TonB family protein
VWPSRPPLFGAVLRRDPGDARRFGAGALAGAIALLALLFGGPRPAEPLVDDPRPMVELRSPVIRVPVSGQRTAEAEPPAAASGHAAEALVVPAGRGDKHVSGSLPAAPADPPAAAPIVPAPVPAPPPEVLPFGEGMSPPRLIEGSDPIYPLAAREARVEGTMLVRCVITTRGTLQRCRVLKSLPYLEQPVLEALAHRRYTPVLFQGRPVDVEYVIPLRFELH